VRIQPARRMALFGFGLALLFVVGQVEQAMAQDDLHLSDVTIPPFVTPGTSSIAAGPSGQVIAVARSAGQVAIVRSTDHGTTFSAPLAISQGTPVRSTRATADEEGHVYVCWFDGRDGRDSLYMNSSSDFGQTWGASDLRVSDTTNLEAGVFVIEAGEGGLVYLLWEESTTSGEILSSLWFRRSTDGGLTFGPQISMWIEELFDETSFPFAIRDDGCGAVYTLFQITDPTVSLFEIFLRTSIDRGESFGPPQSVHGVSTGLIRDPVMACAPGGLVFVVWSDERNAPSRQDVFFYRSVDYGLTFESAVRLNTSSPPGTSRAREINIGADASGSVYVSWRDGTDIRFNVSRDAGVTWAGDRSIGPTMAIERPCLVTNQSGQLAVLWESAVGGERGLELNVSRDFGITWLAGPVRFDEPGGHATIHPLVMDGAGRIYCQWGEVPDGSPTEVHFRAGYPTLGVSIVPRNDGDGIVVVPPEGADLDLSIELRNHHPSMELTGLSAFLEAELSDGRIVGPVIGPRGLNIPVDQRRRGDLLQRFPAGKPAGLYHLVIEAEGSATARTRLPILKQ